MAMPYCTFVLGELGAEIIKIERLGSGDVVRGWDADAKGLSTGFVWVNAHKKSLAIDLTAPEGREALREIAGQVDVFVENLAPGAAGRLGLGHGELRSLFPRLIYCSLSGFGPDGPYGGVKSYDLTLQGESGILLSNGYPGMPAKVGLPITDLIAGSNAIIGIQSALLERERTGEGRFLDVAMLDAALLWLGYFPHHAWHSASEPPLAGMRHQYICPYGPYLAKDDCYVSLAVADDRQWRLFCEKVVGRPEWIDDPRIASIALRRENRALAEKLVEDAIRLKPRDYWIEKLSASGIPYGKVRTMAEVIDHPQAAHRHMFVTAQSEVGDLPLVRFPLADADQERRLPGLGADTHKVLEEFGIELSRRSAMVAAGVIEEDR
ncbi:MAG: CoA transferase [Sphingomonadales bacterium]|nr:CoA transferase [Sphingomonadaceae bacterium]MBS3932542.1 CoA transferase [Sphingomonadales bacterium]